MVEDFSTQFSLLYLLGTSGAVYSCHFVYTGCLLKWIKATLGVENGLKETKNSYAILIKLKKESALSPSLRTAVVAARIWAVL